MITVLTHKSRRSFSVNDLLKLFLFSATETQLVHSPCVEGESVFG